MKMYFNPRSLVTNTILLTVFSYCLWACNKEKDNDSNPTQSQAEEAVRTLENKEIQAILSKDLETLRKLWAPEFIVNSPLLHKLVNRDQVLNMTQNDIISYEKFERNIEHINFMGDVLVTMGEEILIPQKNNPNAGQVIKRRFTNVWQYRNGNWVETNRHAHIVQ